MSVIFPEMKERDINAFFENDAIFVTNEQDDEMDIIDDLVHEISHAVEQKVGDIIYGDGLFQKEFIAKRRRLSALLSQKYDVPSDFNINFEYDRAIDNFLYRDVGYDVLNQVCVGIFPSAYAATSISEYWAMGFEEMFLGDPQKIKSMCPVLYNRLAMTIKEKELKQIIIVIFTSVKYRKRTIETGLKLFTKKNYKVREISWKLVMSKKLEAAFYHLGMKTVSSDQKQLKKC